MPNKFEIGDIIIGTEGEPSYQVVTGLAGDSVGIVRFDSKGEAESFSNDLRAWKGISGDYFSPMVVVRTQIDDGDVA